MTMVAAGALIIGGAGGLALREFGLLDPVLGESLSEAEFGSRLTTEAAAAEKKGYDLGLDRGYDGGYEAGLRYGYQDGLESGYDEGLNEGNANAAAASKSAYDDGFSDGTTNGYSSGLSDGKKQGYSDGFYEGCVSVFDSLSSDAAVGYSVSSRRTGTFYITQSQTC
jgi:flagellar biosynthesis/type III secretory pathway protein FliH